MLIFRKGYIIADRFKVIDHLEGGMSIVYIVSDIYSNQIRCLKTFKTKITHFEEYRELFQKEIKIWIELSETTKIPTNDMNIVRMYGIWDHLHNVYLELEYINGGSLRELMIGRPIPIRIILDLIIQCCTGLEYLSQKMPGFVHRDLKPENLLLKILPKDKIYILKISDYGLSTHQEYLLKLNHDPLEDKRGTLLYMSPEQLRGEKVDIRSDIFAIGIIMFEMALMGMMKSTETVHSIIEELRDSILNSNELPFCAIDFNNDIS